MSTLGSRHASYAPGSDSPTKPHILKGQASTVKPTRDLNHFDLRLEMHGKVMIVDHDTFMDNFVFCPSDETIDRPTDKVFVGMSAPKTEKALYRQIPLRINKEKSCPCPGFYVVATPHRSDPNGSPLRPDAGLYPVGVNAPEPGSKGNFGATDWANIEIPFECKPSLEHDPFDDYAANGQGDSLKRKEAFGQILSYCELVFQKQQRTSTFLVVFMGTYARLAWVDRSGIFATHRFNYIRDEQKLTEFLWRYSKMTPAQRGHDGSVERIAPNSGSPVASQLRERLAKEVERRPNHYITEFFRDSLSDKHPWWIIKVFDEETGQECRFAAAKPNFTAPGVRGRGTRGYVAISIDEDDQLGQDFVYLKDAWRVNLPGIRKEGATLKKLNDAEVPYVPTLVCHGDIPDQVSRSPNVWRKLHPGAENVCPLKDHQHYRVVVKEVGQPLSEFKNSYQLLVALLSCLVAHQAACALGIIHRDISAGNILLYDDGEFIFGYLMDWELAKDESEADSVARQHERTGTWQFMSANVQNNPTRVVVVPDELESLLHVLVFFAVRFLPHNLPAHSVGRFLYDYFDGYSPQSCGPRLGATKRNAVSTGLINICEYIGEESEVKTELRFTYTLPSDDAGVPYKHPLNDLLDILLSWFKALYDSQAAGKSSESTRPRHNFATPIERPVKNPLVWQKTNNKTPALQSNGAETVAHTRLEEDRRARLELAKKLDTHKAMIDLLRQSLQSPEWSAIEETIDKTKDKRPKKGYEQRLARQQFSMPGNPFLILKSQPQGSSQVSSVIGASGEGTDGSFDSDLSGEESADEAAIFDHLTSLESPSQRSFVQSFTESLGKRKQNPEAESSTSKRSKF